jgi:thiol:disulfide interchange protein
MFYTRQARSFATRGPLARWLVMVCGLMVGGCEIRDGASGPAGVETAAMAPPIKPAASASASQETSGEIEFVEGFERGCELARRLRRPMFLFFTARWCQYCRLLAGDAFRQPEVVELSKRFVCVAIDADEEPEICRRFQVRGYPTVIFVSHLAAPFSRVVGKHPASEFVLRMRAALQSVARRSDGVRRR